MGVKRSFAALAALSVAVNAHFTFVRLAHNGEWQAPTRFIRNKTAPFADRWWPYEGEHYAAYNFPTYYKHYEDSVRCGRDNMNHAASTEVLKIAAGDTIEFAHQRTDPDGWTDDMFYKCADERGTCDADGVGPDINHPGPVMAHLSKVPSGQDVTAYDGSGNWLKIYSLGFDWRKDENQKIAWLGYNWNMRPVPRFIFSIPKQTPAGQYLLRIDLVYPGLAPSNITSGSDGQMYPSCAQIEVQSEAEGALPEGVNIPEAFGPNATGMSSSLEMYRFETLDEGYEHAGGPLWDGENVVPDKPVIPS